MRSLPVPDSGPPPLTSSLAYLWWQARQQTGILVLAIALGIIGFLAQAIMPYLLGRALDDGLDDGLGSGLFRWASIMLAIGLVQVFASGLGHRLEVQNWMRSAFGTAQRVADHMSRSGDMVTKDIATGEVVATVATDAHRIGELYFVAARCIGSICAYFAVALLMISTSLHIGLVVVFGLPLVAGALGLLVKPLQARQSVQREESGRLTTLGSDTVSGLRILRGIGGEAVFTDRYRVQSQRVRGAAIKVATTQSYLDGLQVLLPGLFVALVLWLSAEQALVGTLTTGQLITFYGYAAFLSWPLQNLTQALQVTTRAVVSTRKVIRILQVAPASGATAPTRDMPVGPVPLTDVTSGLSLPVGQIIALVSVDPDESAAIATRMGRFHDDDERATPVTLGGILIAELPKDELRSRLVVSEATHHIFSGVLRDELDSRHQASDADILAALHLADAQDVLDSTPGGLDGELPEKGRSLSGGQRQRVALARAILTQAEMLILIEPTSAVDAHTEARIAQRLVHGRSGLATLVVTASPLMLDAMDSVVVVRQGRVITQGSHRELLAGAGEDCEYYRSIVGRDLTPEPTLLPMDVTK